VELKSIIAALLPAAEGKPGALLHIARLMRQDGDSERAFALCRKALALAPADVDVARAANRLLADGVPKWHFSIVRDEARNAAYDAALRRAVRPTSRVLDIGSGTGLLSMMAARAGAAEVITCEMNPAIADAAAEVVARNGFADRIRVVPKHSDALDVDADLGGRADILVSEIVSNNVLGQHVLAAHERAARALLTPDARVIPARAQVRVAPADDTRDGEMRMGEVDGFDLTPFNRFVTRVRGIAVGEKRLQLRGEAETLFDFNLSGRSAAAPAQASVTCRSHGGRVSGIAQWIAIDLDEETRYENRPEPGAGSCWAVLFYPLAQPIDTVAGQEIRVHGSHDRRTISVWGD